MQKETIYCGSKDALIKGMTEEFQNYSKEELKVLTDNFDFNPASIKKQINDISDKDIPFGKVSHFVINKENDNYRVKIVNDFIFIRHDYLTI